MSDPRTLAIQAVVTMLTKGLPPCAHPGFPDVRVAPYVQWSETAVLLTESDVAARLAVSIHTVRKWRRRKTGPPYVKIGRSVRYPQGRLQEFIEDSTPPRGEAPKPQKREEDAE